MRTILWTIFLAMLISPAIADSIDDAEAKKRGVSPQQVQLERAQQQISALQAQVAALKAENETLRQKLAAIPDTATAPKEPAKLPAPRFVSDGSPADDRIEQYLIKHPDTTDATIVAMHNGIPKPGMTEDQIMVFGDVYRTLTENLEGKVITFAGKADAAGTKFFHVNISKEGVVQQVTEILRASPISR